MIAAKNRQLLPVYRVHRIKHNQVMDCAHDATVVILHVVIRADRELSCRG